MNAPLPRSQHHYSYEEYLAFERDSETKHEFVGGEIFAMGGGTARHNALAFRVGGALYGALPPDRTAFQSDMRVRILATGRATYPDISVVCGPIEYDPADPRQTTIINPTLLIEVLSPTTEEVDRGDKRRDYQRIPSLQEYVMIGQDPRVEIDRRAGSGRWEHFVVREGSVRLATGATLDLSILYANLPQ